MIARDILDKHIAPLRTSSSGEDALHTMSEAMIRHLPIVNEEQLLGTLSEDDILDHDIMEPIGSYDLSLQKAFVQEDDHIFEIIQVLANHNLTAIPVVDKQLNYLGTITQHGLIRYFANSYSFKDPGSILVLKMSDRDYSLAEISRLVEMDNARILSTFITEGKEEGTIFLTLKLNTQNLTTILATLRRFNYDIYSSFTELEYLDALKERYDALMAYLNV